MENKEIKENYQVCIIGAGIIGCAISYYLSRYNLKVLLLEKNPLISDETSHGNSGLIHGGFDADKENESKLNIEGNNIWRHQLLKDLKIPFQNINSLVVAFNNEEMKEVEKLYQRGIHNNLDPKSMKIIDKKQVKEIEPLINDKVQGALLCTSSVLIDPVSASRAMVSVALKNGVELRKNAEVTNIKQEKDFFELEVNGKTKIKTAFIINASGHQADLLSKKAKQKDFTLVARRGEYRVLARSEYNKVKNVIFKIPSIFGKGVLVAPMLDKRVLVGPTAEENIKKDDTRLVTRSKYDYIGQVGHDLIPTLNIERTEKTFAGSRPIFQETNDFLIENSVSKNFINVAGTQSPALSSSPAIALRVIKMLQEANLELKEKTKFKTKFEIIF